MATVKGIQMRRGLEADFDPSKLNPGEFAVAVDTRRVWLCFASGVVKELGLLDDINAQLAKIEHKGILGTLKFDETGDPIKTPVYVTIKDGKYVSYGK